MTTTTMTLADHVARLQSAGFTVAFVAAEDVAKVRDNGWVDHVWTARHAEPGDVPHVNLSSIAFDEDRTGQVDTVRRSNYRTIRRDFDSIEWVDFAYMEGNTLGALVGDLDSDMVDMLVKLAEEYPVYDEEDQAELERDEIESSIEEYVIFDVGGYLSVDDAERWHDLSTGEQVAVIHEYTVRHGSPEHNGLEVLWDYAELADFIAPRL